MLVWVSPWYVEICVESFVLEDVFWLTDSQALLHIYTLHVVVTLEDMLAYENHWIHLGRMCCDVFRSPISSRMDHHEYFWSG